MKNKLLLPVVLTLLLCAAFSTESVFAKKWIVSVSDFRFTPSKLNHVEARDTIQWIWVEGTHTTTSTTIPLGADPWDSPISQSHPSFIYVPTTNGSYSYQCTPHSTTTLIGSFLVTGASGISSGKETPQVSVVPNPFTDRITINMEGNTHWVKTINLYTMKGALLQCFRYEKASQQGIITLELNDLASGVYLIGIIDNSGNSVVRRIVRK